MGTFTLWREGDFFSAMKVNYKEIRVIHIR